MKTFKSDFLQVLKQGGLEPIQERVEQNTSGKRKCLMKMKKSHLVPAKEQGFDWISWNYEVFSGVQHLALQAEADANKFKK